MFTLPPPTELLSALTYRRPMRVRELMVFECGFQTDSYYVCPRCRITMEREFMAYCDRCGQHLDWKRFSWAKVIRPKGKGRGARACRP